MPRVFRLSDLQAELPAEVVASFAWPSNSLEDGKLRVRCVEHDLECLIAPGNLRRGQRGCPVCADANRKAANSNKSEAAIAQAFEMARIVHKGKYDYSLANPNRVVDTIEIGCPEHGVFRQTLVSHSRGHGCAACAGAAKGAARTDSAWGERKPAIEEFCSTRGYTVVGELDAPRKWLDEVRVRCPHHGEFLSTVRSLVQGKGCWKCYAEFRAGKKSQIASAAAFVEKATRIHEGRYDYSRFKYVDSYTKGEVICKKHGTVFLVAPGNHVQGKGCPKCGVQLSKAEDEIAAFLRQYATVVQREKTIIAPRELDIYLPAHGLAIEYHGLFWHTEGKVGGLHRAKWQACTDKGIELWQIFEDEWRDSAEKIKTRLLARIGMVARVAARKCVVEEVSEATAREFLGKHHMQGYKAGTMVLGLMHDGALVAVASFGRLRTGAMVAGSGWEVLRYATVGTVVGGFGKLFSAFVKRVSPDEVVSFCDLRWGTGRVYRAAGFNLDHVTAPDYWWLAARSGRVRIPRYQTQKHKLKTHPTLGKFYSDNLSEAAICAAAGWEKILGVGHQRWVWTALDTPQKP